MINDYQKITRKEYENLRNLAVLTVTNTLEYLQCEWLFLDKRWRHWRHRKRCRNQSPWNLRCLERLFTPHVDKSHCPPEDHQLPSLSSWDIWNHLSDRRWWRTRDTWTCEQCHCRGRGYFLGDLKQDRWYTEHPQGGWPCRIHNGPRRLHPCRDCRVSWDHNQKHLYQTLPDKAEDLEITCCINTQRPLRQNQE